jgi:hypothetical protein
MEIKGRFAMALYQNWGAATLAAGETNSFEYYYGDVGNEVGISIAGPHFSGQPGGEGDLKAIEQGKSFNAVTPYIVYEVAIRNDSPWSVSFSFDAGTFQ